MRLLLAVALSLAACRFGGEEKEPRNQPPIGEGERVRMESEALSSLAAMEAALAAYVRDKHRAPGKLEDLVPAYIAAIPYLELGILDHRASNKTEVYPPGAPRRDTGHWGFSSNPAGPVVFIDCAHEDSRGKPWNQEKGAL